MFREKAPIGGHEQPWSLNHPRLLAYLSALVLVAVQVSMGIILKVSQSNGTYPFSPSASVFISEALKTILATLLFWRECKTKIASGVVPRIDDTGMGYSLLEDGPVVVSDRPKCEEDEAYCRSRAPSLTQSAMQPTRALSVNLTTLWACFCSEMDRDVRYGLCNLAMFYVLINNSIFMSYQVAGPGTVQLVKSSSTFITALVMITTLGTRLSKIQWIAVTQQICGLLVTQHDVETGMSYPISTYLVLLFQVFLAATSGVYNQSLMQKNDSSLHANNMVLYAAGFIVNALIHVAVCILKPNEPRLFQGLNNASAIMVIMSNVSIGIATSAVYKYADALVKCFATGVTTGILLLLSSIFFEESLGLLVIPGMIVAFLASWLYMDNPPRIESSSSSSATSTTQSRLVNPIISYIETNRLFILTCSASITVAICCFLSLYST